MDSCCSEGGFENVLVKEKLEKIFILKQGHNTYMFNEEGMLGFISLGIRFLYRRQEIKHEKIK